MKDVFGRPGTKAGLCLRIGQFLFAAISAATLLLSLKDVVVNTVAYSWLVWSFLMGCLDVFALATNIDLRAARFTSILLGDAVLSTLFLGATCSLAGVEIFFIYGLCLHLLFSFLLISLRRVL